jgi:2-methylcitrate dehydratase PrpD
MVRRVSAFSLSKEAVPSTMVARRGKAPADAGRRRVDRSEERREREELQRFERAPLDGEAVEDDVEVRRRAKPDLTRAREEPRGFRRRRERGRDRARVLLRLELRQALDARRRLRKPYDGRDNAIEFERFESSGVHGSMRAQPA